MAREKIPLFNFLDLLVCRRVSSPTFYEKITFGRKEGGKNFPVDFFIFLFQLHLLQSKRQKMGGGDSTVVSVCASEPSCRDSNPGVPDNL